MDILGDEMSQKSRFYVLYDPTSYKVLATSKIVSHNDDIPGHEHWVCIEEPKTLNTILPGMYYHPENNTFTGLIRKVETKLDVEQPVIRKEPESPPTRASWLANLRSKFIRW